MFEKRFYNVLEEDLMNMMEVPKPHHQVAIRGIDRKNPNQIPDIHKVSGNTSERKILKVKDHGGTCTCNNTDVQYIITKYKINNLDQKPRQLGKTGVIIMKTPHGNYILTK